MCLPPIEACASVGGSLLFMPGAGGAGLLQQAYQRLHCRALRTAAVIHQEDLPLRERLRQGQLNHLAVGQRLLCHKVRDKANPQILLHHGQHLCGGGDLDLRGPVQVLLAEQAAVKLVGGAVLRGAGRMMQFMIATLTDLVLRVVLAVCLSRTALGAVGIWCAWPIGWCVATGMSLAFYARSHAGGGHIRRS